MEEHVLVLVQTVDIHVHVLLAILGGTALLILMIVPATHVKMEGHVQ